MRYLLDTNVVSELRKLQPHGAVVAWLTSLPKEDVLMSAVTIGEMQVGIEATRRQDPQRAVEIQVWVDRLEAAYRVLPMDSACFRIWGEFMARRPAQLSLDAMIAATAQVHGLTVATRHESDFKHFPVPWINPFKPQP